MRWLRGLIGLGVMGAATVWVLGSRVPLEHVATASGVVSAGQDRVWEIVTDVPTQAGWRKGISSTRRIEPISPNCWTEARSSVAVALCEVEMTPRKRMVLRIVEPTAGFGGDWTYELAPVDEGRTRITITERTVIRSALFRFVGRYVMRGDTAVQQYVEDLQAEAVRVRSGEDGLTAGR